MSKAQLKQLKLLKIKCAKQQRRKKIKSDKRKNPIQFDPNCWVAVSTSLGDVKPTRSPDTSCTIKRSLFEAQSLFGFVTSQTYPVDQGLDQSSFKFFSTRALEYDLSDQNTSDVKIYTVSEINKTMRLILINWLYEVAATFKLLPNHVHTAVNTIDRIIFADIKTSANDNHGLNPTQGVVTKKTLQGYGSAALFITLGEDYQFDYTHTNCSVTGESKSRSLDRFSYITANAFDTCQLKHYIHNIYKLLDYNIEHEHCTSFSFLVLLVNHLECVTEIQFMQCMYLVDKLLIGLSIWKSNLSAIASMYMVLLLHDKIHEARCVLAFTGYSFGDIKDIVENIYLIIKKTPLVLKEKEYDGVDKSYIKENTQLSELYYKHYPAEKGQDNL